jgi:hypothetical protein
MGVGTFVAVGESETDANKIGTSTDGSTWKVATNTGGLFSGGYLNRGQGIAYGLVNGVGTFVAVGASATAANRIGTSTDGLTWKVATNVGSLFSGGIAGGIGIAYGLVNGVGTFVAVGRSDTDANQIGTSLDGLTWKVATDVGSLFSGGGIPRGLSIAYGLVNGVGTFVAGGNSSVAGNRIGTSTDGLTWKTAPNVGNLFDSDDIGCRGIAYGTVNGVGTFVAVGSSTTDGTQIATSLDGLTWKVATNIGSLFSDNGGGFGIVFAPPTPTPTPLISNICFPAGTKVRTDQGEVFIEAIRPGIHTIHKKAIQHVTKTISTDKYLIRVEQHALGKNKPTKPTVMSKDHKVEYDGYLVPVYRLLDYLTGVKKVKYSGELLYNVLLAEYGTMSVNNLTCETLEPTSPIACVYRGVAYKEVKEERGRFKLPLH